MSDQSNRPSDTQSEFDPIPVEDLSGFNTYIGLQIVEWRDGFARLELSPQPHHLNRSAGLHGGVTSTLIDAAGGYCGTFLAVPGRVKRAVTLSLSVSFIGRATPGALISCIGERRGGGRSTFMASCEVRDATGLLVATGQGVYRNFGEGER